MADNITNWVQNWKARIDYVYVSISEEGSHIYTSPSLDFQFWTQLVILSATGWLATTLYIL